VSCERYGARTEIGSSKGRRAKRGVAGAFTGSDEGREANDLGVALCRAVAVSVAGVEAGRARVGVGAGGGLAGAGAEEGALARVEARAAVLVRHGRGRVGERVHEIVACERARGEAASGGGGEDGG
jgi:hypothetical protein